MSHVKELERLPVLTEQFVCTGCSPSPGRNRHLAGGVHYPCSAPSLALDICEAVSVGLLLVPFFYYNVYHPTIGHHHCTYPEIKNHWKGFQEVTKSTLYLKRWSCLSLSIKVVESFRTAVFPTAYSRTTLSFAQGRFFPLSNVRLIISV